MTPVSAVLIAQNEERKLADALASVAFCQERLVVDSGSTDRTREIAARAGARVLVNSPFPGFVPQRSFATERAEHDWVLAIDADERVSPELRAEIEALRARGFDRAAYRMPRVATYLGREIRGTDWYPDAQVRLFDRRRARWQGALVHESVAVAGPVGRLRSELVHLPYDDVSAHLRKIDWYTSLWAEQARDAGRRTGALELVLAPAWAFVRNYVLKRGFALGAAGFSVSKLNAHYTFVKLLKLRVLQAGR